MRRYQVNWYWHWHCQQFSSLLALIAASGPSLSVRSRQNIEFSIDIFCCLHKKWRLFFPFHYQLQLSSWAIVQWIINETKSQLKSLITLIFVYPEAWLCVLSKHIVFVMATSCGWVCLAKNCAAFGFGVYFVPFLSIFPFLLAVSAAIFPFFFGLCPLSARDFIRAIEIRPNTTAEQIDKSTRKMRFDRSRKP